MHHCKDENLVVCGAVRGKLIERARHPSIIGLHSGADVPGSKAAETRYGMAPEAPRPR